MPGHSDYMPSAGKSNPWREIKVILLGGPNAILGNFNGRESDSLRTWSAVDPPNINVDRPQESAGRYG